MILYELLEFSFVANSKLFQNFRGLYLFEKIHLCDLDASRPNIFMFSNIECVKVDSEYEFTRFQD